jgi:hypothetical protein
MVLFRSVKKESNRLDSEKFHPIDRFDLILAPRAALDGFDLV